jgi:hypothetical protein
MTTKNCLCCVTECLNKCLPRRWTPPPLRKYPCFDAEVRLAWSGDPDSYAGGSVATSRVFHVTQVKGDDADKKGYLGPPGWGLGVGLSTPRRKTYLLRNFNQSLGMGVKGYEDSGKVSELEHGTLEQCTDLDRNAGTGMLRGCWDAGTGEDRQRIERHGGGGLKRPRPKFGCNGTQEEEGVGGDWPNEEDI